MTDATFTFRVDGRLKTAFNVAARAADRSAAQVLRAAMRDFVSAQAPVPAPPTRPSDWLYDKVAAARASLAAGEGYGEDEMKARFARVRSAARAAASEALR